MENLTFSWRKTRCCKFTQLFALCGFSRSITSLKHYQCAAEWYFLTHVDLFCKRKMGRFQCVVGGLRQLVLKRMCVCSRDVAVDDYDITHRHFDRITILAPKSHAHFSAFSRQFTYVCTNLFYQHNNWIIHEEYAFGVQRKWLVVYSAVSADCCCLWEEIRSEIYISESLY